MPRSKKIKSTKTQTPEPATPPSTCKYCSHYHNQQHQQPKSDTSSSPPLPLLVLKCSAWTLLLLVLVLVTVWQVAMLVQDFLAEPHYIGASYFEFDRKALFPNVTVCNFNRVNRTKADELGVNELVIEQVFIAQVAGNGIFTTSYNGNRTEEQSTAWTKYKNRPDIPDELKDASRLLRYLGHSCESSLLLCIFGDESFNCCQSAVEVLSGEYGRCWVVNAPIFTAGHNQPRQSWRGISGGLRLLIDPGIDEYLGGDAINNNNLENGIMVTPSFNPYQPYYTEAVAVSPGTHARIAMNKRLRDSKEPRLEVFPRSCSDRRGLDYTLADYDFPTCVDDCVQNFVIKACRCAKMQEMPPKYTDLPTCDGDQVNKCAKDVTELKYLDCLTQCKPTCNEIMDIFTVTSTTRWPGEQFKHNLPIWLKETYGISWSANVTQKMNEVILVDVFFPSTYYTMVEETEKTTLFALIGNIGGHLGLWLGMSIVTFVQLGNSLCHWIWSAYKKHHTHSHHLVRDSPIEVRSVNGGSAKTNA